MNTGISRRLKQITPIGRIARWRMHRLTDAYVVSFPKSGRTWLRFLVAKALAMHYGCDNPHVWEPLEVRNLAGRGPRVRFSHDGSDRPRTVGGAFDTYADKNVVLLARDPRDVIVSWYFHRTRRSGKANKHTDIDSFAQDPEWGVPRIVDFLRDWYAHRDRPRGFLLVRYEDLHSSPHDVLAEVLRFVGVLGVDEAVIDEAVEAGAFDKMKALAGQGINRALDPTDPSDEESHKMRKGKVGGYADYLRPETIASINALVRSLPSDFGYR